MTQDETASRPSVPGAEQVPLAAAPAQAPARQRLISKNWRTRATVLRHHNFRIFYIGYSTSQLGSFMSYVAIAFAVLDSGGGAAAVGYVAAARIIPRVVFILGGGVLADKIGRRTVMLGADSLRGCAQAALAVTLFLGRPELWIFLVLAVLLGTGEAFFRPAFGAITVELVPEDDLVSANALVSFGAAAAGIAGPVLAGIIVAAAGPATVIAVDAGTYGVSLIALTLLRLPDTPPPPSQPLSRYLLAAWHEVSSRSWLWATTLQFALFNLITWGPFLVLGPVLADRYLGGASSWGVIQAAEGVGAIIGGIAVMQRKPERPLVVATIATFGYPLPCLMLALRAPTALVATGALCAGLGETVFITFWMTTLQRQIPRAALARVSSITTFCAVGVGALGLVFAGPAASLVGATHLLGISAAWAVLSTLAVLVLPAVRHVSWAPEPAEEQVPDSA
jgi:MFS family permease